MGAGPATRAQARRSWWWQKDADFDAEVRGLFAAAHAALAEGKHMHWLDSPRGRLAAVIVLDPFSRNMFRDTPGMYAADALAVSWAQDGVDRGWDKELQGAARAFLYMPFMHSEELSAQERCVALFSAFRDELPGGAYRDDLSRNVSFAEQPRDIVARFGRSPHRNASLGRESTPEEQAFLLEDGSSF
ncbi:MAG: DUF924 domain-containing protein [Myxococcales bacterium]|nr:DUF924 domain-containing protein [Myxococcales bacterium]